MLGIVEQSESAFCVVSTTQVQLGSQCSHCSVHAEIKNKTWNSWEFNCHKNININIICNIIIFIKGDISPDLRDFRFPSPDHQTCTDFNRFGEKSPGVATLILAAKYRNGLGMKMLERGTSGTRIRRERIGSISKRCF